ncbi:hypothetical protein FJY90_04815 [Candidatus Gottesmanbacteria bacterium]|nr:hypothetical protein [Candidatus Gottesmanbacteria bacterium]
MINPEMQTKFIIFLIPILILIFIFSLVENMNKSRNEVIKSAPVKITPSLALEIVIITETPIPTITNKPSLLPTITLTPIPVGALNDLFIKYSNRQSVSYEVLKKIAFCESRLNSNARFKDYGGLFQFSTVSWVNTRRNMNLDTNPDLRFNPEESIKTAAFKLATEGIFAWPNCSK